MPNHRATQEETAHAYGRCEGCFLDYKTAPFRFKDIARNIQSTSLTKDTYGLVAEPGLRVGAFPKTSIDLDERLDAADSSYLLGVTSDDNCNVPENKPPLLSGAAFLRDLQLPLELPEPDTEPAKDLVEYRKAVDWKRFGDPFAQWLPVFPTKDEEDEGLHFPVKAAKLHSLLLRQLDCEHVEVSEEAASLEEMVRRSAHEGNLPIPFNTFESLSKRVEADPVSPPLSPMSEESYYTPYEPGSAVCLIDLTSEPTSPVMPEILDLEKSIHNGMIESGPPTNEAILGRILSSPSLSSYSNNHTVKLGDLELDVPFASMDTTSSGGASKEYALKTPGLLNNLAISHPTSEDRPIESFFEDAFEITLESYQTSVTMRVEQERFDPVDSISRISVPNRDFTIDKADWMRSTSSSKGLSSAKCQFARVQMQHTSQKNLMAVPRSAIAESSLRWAPFSPDSGFVSTSETLEIPLGQADTFLSLDSVPALNSESYVPRMAGLSVEHLEEGEEELAPDDEGEEEEDLEASEETLYVDSSHFKSPSGMIASEASEPSLEHLVSAAARKRRRAQTLGGDADTLPSTTNAGATSKLLAGFMEMRAVKKPRNARVSEYVTASNTLFPPTPLSKPPNKEHALIPASTISEESEILTPAPAPEVIIPAEKGCFLISVKLERSILRHIESSWPQDHLIDRDYAIHDKALWNPGSANRKYVSSPLSFDADIALTPTIGVIVTTLSKAKQKPLPKSKTLPQLRDRVLQVSRKFETLFVLVSECNPVGEYTSGLHPSDAESYADFVRFIIGLEAGVLTYFVPGSSPTMAKWILNLMCRYTPNALDCKPYINAVESTWETFFRRAGMNAFAAQVLAGIVFEKGGNEGLARLMASSPQEIIETFEQTLGGRKALAHLSELLCKPWR